MKQGQVYFVLAAVGACALAACGGSTASSNDAGAGEASASGSGSSGSSSSSSGSGSGSGSSSSGGDDGGGNGGDDGGPVANDCPNCQNQNDVCCVAIVSGTPTGACAAPGTCTGGVIDCGSASDCNTGELCCATGATSTRPPASHCAASCTASELVACDTGMPMCPNGAVCQDSAGTSNNYFSVCVGGTSEAGTTEAGTTEAGVSDATAADGEAGSSPVDAAGN